jgi:hypothetical protein
MSMSLSLSLSLSLSYSAWTLDDDNDDDNDDERNRARHFRSEAPGSDRATAARRACGPPLPRQPEQVGRGYECAPME